MPLAIIGLVVVVALLYAYTNGFHDASNAVATSISTRALTPRIALTMAASMNFLGALLGERVAETIRDTVEPPPGLAGLALVLAGLLAAIVWNLITWAVGFPSSSSHALIGGLVGAALVSGAQVHWATLIDKVVYPMVWAPAVGFIGAYLLMVALQWSLRDSPARRAGSWLRLAQTVSAAAFALGHGLQDAQKTMAVILLALVAGGYADGEGLPLWVVLASALAISAGTFAGGWRIIRTIGRRLIRLDPAQGFAAETVGAAVLYLTAFVSHAPISTTYTISAAVAGAGATRRLSAVRWGVARSIVTAWLLTVPITAAVAACGYGAARILL